MPNHRLRQIAHVHLTIFPPPKIIAAKANSDFTIDVLFNNGICKQLDMRILFAAKWGHAYERIKNDPLAFVTDFKFNAHGIYWDDIADVAEWGVWRKGRTVL